MTYELDKIERRVLGALIEKGYTTPDQYPLSLNGIVNACNQKSCRDPLMSLDEVDVFDAIDTLRKKGLVITAMTSGSRVDKYRHCVPDMLEIQAKECATLAELLLRGPQTDGELRQRASRMVQINDLAQLNEILETLQEKSLVKRLSPPGQKRGARFAHMLYPENEQPHVEADAPAPAAGRRAAPALPADEVEALREAIHALTERVAALERASGIHHED